MRRFKVILNIFLFAAGILHLGLSVFEPFRRGSSSHAFIGKIMRPVDSVREVDRQTDNIRCIKIRIVSWKIRLCTTHAGDTAPRFAASLVTEKFVTGGMRHGALATQMEE